MPDTNFDVIVVGAGAAGMMCAIEAGKRGRSVIVLERNDAFGKKIRISGGGRCNFTNIHTAPENFICGNSHFHKSALAGYTPSDFIALVERHRIRYHEKKLGQLFCDGTSDEILNMLRKEAEKAKVHIQTNRSVTSIRRKDRFLIETNKESLTCESLVIATGGLSIPRIGATGFGHAIAKQFGLRVTGIRPGLVPLLAGPWPELSGVSLDANVSLRDATFHEKILFTHRGLSGPAILQISSYWKPGETISIHPLTTATSTLFPILEGSGMEGHTDGHRRLRESGSHCRRRRHRMSYLPKQWRPGVFRASILSEKLST